MRRAFPIPLISFPDGVSEAEGENKSLRLLLGVVLFCRYAHMDVNVLIHSEKIRRLFNDRQSVLRDLIAGAVLRLIVRTPSAKKVLDELHEEKIDRNFLSHCLSQRVWNWPTAIPKSQKRLVFINGRPFYRIEAGTISGDPDISSFSSPLNPLRELSGTPLDSHDLIDDVTLEQFLTDGDCQKEQTITPSVLSIDPSCCNPEIFFLDVEMCEQLLKKSRLRELRRSRSDDSARRQRFCRDLFSILFSQEVFWMSPADIEHLKSKVAEFLGYFGVNEPCRRANQEIVSYRLFDLVGLLAFWPELGRSLESGEI